jgi:hypothetical protein
MVRSVISNSINLHSLSTHAAHRELHRRGSAGFVVAQVKLSEKSVLLIQGILFGFGALFASYREACKEAFTQLFTGKRFELEFSNFERSPSRPLKT